MAGQRLELVDLGHRFGELIALDGVSFSVDRGEIIGLVGRNGAGKTTTMRSVMGILQPQRGTVKWSGHAVAAADRQRFGPHAGGARPLSPNAPAGPGHGLC